MYNFFIHFADDMHFWHPIIFNRMLSSGTMPSQFCHGLLVRNTLNFALPKAVSVLLWRKLSLCAAASKLRRVVIWFTLVTSLEYACYYYICYADGEGGVCMGQMGKGRHAWSRWGRTGNAWGRRGMTGGCKGQMGKGRGMNEVQRNSSHCGNKMPQGLLLLFPKLAAF